MHRHVALPIVRKRLFSDKVVINDLCSDWVVMNENLGTKAYSLSDIEFALEYELEREARWTYLHRLVNRKCMILRAMEIAKLKTLYKERNPRRRARKVARSVA